MQVIQEATVLEDQGDIRQAKALLQQYSLALAQLVSFCIPCLIANLRLMQSHSSVSCGMQSPLAGFRYAPDVYRLYYTDRLHQSNMGPAQILTRMIQDHCECHLARLNEYINSLPAFPGLKLPSFGLTPGEKATAIEFADLFKVLPVALLLIPALRAKFLHATQGRMLCVELSCLYDLFCVLALLAELLEFHTLRDLEQHTEMSLTALDMQRKRQVMPTYSEVL